MTKIRFVQWQKATTLAPIAALSAAATVVVAGVGGPVGTLTAADDQVAEGAITVPEGALEAPASVSLPEAVSPATNAAVVGASSTSGIPAVALGAYQRAQTIINGADASCRISWQLIAAIGRVESDHGRFGGSQLDDEGVATPGIYGIPLTGANGTAQILDTDAGELDNDATYDRAVGPMQFIPSTWRVVGVDADRDGTRDPQNINDAALAAAVYLCSGSEDLSTDAGKRASVKRYNNSDAYVDLVLAIEQAYLQGEYTSVPNAVASANYFVPDPVAPRPNDAGSTDTAAGGGTTPGSTGGSTGGATPGTGGGSTGGTGGGSTGGTGGTGGDTGGDGGGTVTPPSTGGDGGTVTPPSTGGTPIIPPTGGSGSGLGDIVEDPVGTVEETVQNPIGTVVDTLSWAEANLRCLGKLGAAWQECMRALGH